MKSNFFKYLGSIIKSDSNDSSKRFIALVCLFLVTFIVLLYTDTSNYVTVLEILLGFIAVLLGVAVWQDIRKTRIEKDSNKK